MTADEELLKRARTLYAQVQGGAGVDRNVLPEDQRGSVARGLWYDPTFTYGIEYGVLVALWLLFGDDVERGE